MLSNNFDTPSNLIGIIGCVGVYLPSFISINVGILKPFVGKYFAKCCKKKKKNKIVNDDDPNLGTINDQIEEKGNDQSTIDVTMTKGWGPLAKFGRRNW